MEEIAFLEHLKNRMNTACIRHTKLLNKKISKVAVAGGAGSFLLPDARAKGADIFITGDFKFDWTEIGEKFDLVKLAEIGKKGVDLLLSDSTNSEVEGNTPSEAKVVKRLENIITEATGRVIITSFASNVYRLKKVI